MAPRPLFDAFLGMRMVCHLNTVVSGIFRPVFTFVDPPEEFPGEFPPGAGDAVWPDGVFVLAGLGVGSG